MIDFAKIRKKRVCDRDKIAYRLGMKKRGIVITNMSDAQRTANIRFFLIKVEKENHEIIMR